MSKASAGKSSGDLSDDFSDDSGNSPPSANLMTEAMKDEVTSKLALAGPVGVSAATAIISTKRKQTKHSFETNPSYRKLQENRLMRKLKKIVDEYVTRIDQQAVVIIATPHSPMKYKVFGAKPLEHVLKNLEPTVMNQLEQALTCHLPPHIQDDPTLFTLPKIIIDGIPASVEDMTQAQLRSFIPLMMKYSLKRAKPGWGKELNRPPWWPKEIPYANIRLDTRSDEEKSKISWTKALRKIIIQCYKYHGREDLLVDYGEKKKSQPNNTESTSQNDSSTIFILPEGTTLYQVDSTTLIHDQDQMDVDSNNTVINIPNDSTLYKIQSLEINVESNLTQSEEVCLVAGQNSFVPLANICSNTDGSISITTKIPQNQMLEDSQMLSLEVENDNLLTETNNCV